MAEDTFDENHREVDTPGQNTQNAQNAQNEENGQSKQSNAVRSRKVAPSTRGAKTRAETKYWMLVAFAVLAVAYAGNEFTPMMVFYRGENVFGSVFVDALLACYAAGIAAACCCAGRFRTATAVASSCFPPRSSALSAVSSLPPVK